MNVKQKTFLRRAVYLSGFKNFASVVQFFQKRSFVGSSARSVRGLVVGTACMSSDRAVLIDVFAHFGTRA